MFLFYTDYCSKFKLRISHENKETQNLNKNISSLYDLVSVDCFRYYSFSQTRVLVENRSLLQRGSSQSKFRFTYESWSSVLHVFLIRKQKTKSLLCPKPAKPNAHHHQIFVTYLKKLGSEFSYYRCGLVLNTTETRNLETFKSIK